MQEHRQITGRKRKRLEKSANAGSKQLENDSNTVSGVSAGRKRKENRWNLEQNCKKTISKISRKIDGQSKKKTIRKSCGVRDGLNNWGSGGGSGGGGSVNGSGGRRSGGCCDIDASMRSGVGYDRRKAAAAKAKAKQQQQQQQWRQCQRMLERLMHGERERMRRGRQQLRQHRPHLVISSKRITTFLGG